MFYNVGDLLCWLRLGCLNQVCVLPVSVTKNNSFLRAFALQSSGRNCSPPPDFVLRRLLIPRVLFSGGVSQTPVFRVNQDWAG